MAPMSARFGGRPEYSTQNDEPRGAERACNFSASMMPTIFPDSPRPERSKTVEKPGVGIGQTHQQFISPRRVVPQKLSILGSDERECDGDGRGGAPSAAAASVAERALRAHPPTICRLRAALHQELLQ